MAGQRPLAVLEVGAGTGVFTRAILRQLGPSDRFDVYEINPAFQAFLESELGQARAQARLHMGDIMQLAPEVRYDFIISGLPLNNFPAAAVRAILTLLMEHLERGGTLSYFEYPFLRTLKYPFVRNAAERQRLKAVGAVVEHFLRQHSSRAQTVALNLPPAVARHISCNTAWETP